jgi:2-polyprenyl-6-methoxyphenol hydroxylase-like FAD-dependent oxidoreductase
MGTHRFSTAGWTDLTQIQHLPSPDAWREQIAYQNDGTMPREPYQRCSQALFEAWLKPYLQAEPLIDTHFGLKLDSLTEADGGVTCHFSDVTSSEQHIVHCDYVIGCDGAGSRVRKSMGGTLIGGPM